MEISRRADYAMRVILDLAMLPSGMRARARDIARRQAIPYAFLQKIIRDLCAAGFIEASRGRRGGVRLARPPESITLLEVLEAMEGPIRLNRCSREPHLCPRSSFCAIHPIWAQAQAYLEQLLGSTTFAEVAKRGRQIRMLQSRNGMNGESASLNQELTAVRASEIK
ncbi:MAG TPA: Rrf2 family transcriptional regulator [Thermoflexus sp.]|nr:Rrf2 family transcriptional regulator [Thermoflexus sp.]